MNVPGELPIALARRLAQLSPEKRAFVERQMQRALPTAGVAAIPPRAGRGPAPLSFSQEHLWHIEQSAPGLSTYHVPRAMRVIGPLDIDLLRSVLATLVDRHEVLRTTIEVVAGAPRAVVRPARPPSLEIVDLRDCVGANRESELQRVLRDAVSAPFDLTRDVLVRATVVALGVEDHALALVWHHLASDEASARILFGDLAALYNGRCAGAPVTLPPVGLQYADFATWQRTHWSGPRLDELVSQWAQRLAAAPQGLDLPLDRPRLALPNFAGERRTYTFSRTLSHAVTRLGRAQGATPFVVLLAAFQTLLHRYAGQPDVYVGSVVTGRGRGELDGVLGYFSNVLPLGAHFAGDPAFDELLAQVHETYVFALDHGDIPFEQLAAEIGERDFGDGVASFSSMFAMTADGPAVPALDGLVLTPIAIDRGIAKLDLMVGVAIDDDGLRFSVEYRTQLFDGSTIDRMFDNFGTLLESITSDPTRRASKLALLGPTERRSLAQRNATAAAYPATATLDELIAAQAACTPDAIAVECIDATGAIVRLTYGELRRRAGVVAAHLRALGIGPDIGVGVCLERSLDLIVALLGVLESGGYYVPLDPQYPSDRLAYMVADAAVPVLLTDEPSAAAVEPLLSADAAPRIVRMNALWAQIEAGVDAAGPQPPPRRTSESLAYTIYTSGSTGRPKGVMIPHRAVVNYLTWMQRVYPLGLGDGVFQRAPISFDASIWELFAPLIAGGRLVLAPPTAHLDPLEILAALERHAVAVAQFVPSQLQMILDGAAADAPRVLGRLRRLFLGGERLPGELLHRVLAACPSLPITNLYGPTEATVYATHWRVEQATRTAGSVVALGGPIANATIYLTDSEGELVPTGVAGELCIGGLGLARGYHDRPELTAERFVPDRFGPDPSGRLYRTGDLARYRADGTLEYLGRLDTQVKLRGFRVELGEIESTLAATTEVQSAVVLVRADDPGALIAYCIPARAASADELAGLGVALRRRLGELLPDFMVPGTFVWLDAWPLNVNGKLDRAALETRLVGEGRAAKTFVAPRTSLEAGVAEIWAGVLRRERVGVHDDFFALGGHSLLAMRVLARVAATLGKRLTLRAFFEASTVAAFAARLERSALRAPVTFERIAPRPTGASVALSAAQEELWLLQQAGDAGAYNVRAAWRLRGPFAPKALQSALDALVARHAALRTVFSAVAGEPRQTVADARPIESMELDVSGAPAEHRLAQALRALTDCGRRSFDLARDQLIRALVIRLDVDDHVLLLVSHHIVCDGASLEIMYGELALLYEAALGDRTANLPALQTEFADFIGWQRERRTGEQLEIRAAYWRERLAGASTALGLPTDRPRGPLPSFAGAHHVAVVGPAVLEGLRLLSARTGTSLFALLLTGYAILLHRCTGQTDIVIGTPVEARELPELEGVVGYFVNTLPIRVRFDADPTFVELATSVREGCLGAFEQQPLPADALRDAPTTLFGFVPSVERRRCGPLLAETVDFETGSAKFDLAFSLRERADGLRLSVEYRTALFDAPTVARLARYFATLLESIVAEPESRVSALRLVTAAERRQALLDSRATATAWPVTTVDRLFAEQVARTPEATAVEDASAALSYAALDAWAETIAERLRARGVGPGVLVAVCAERSVAVVAALLGVLKAGGAFVPLDPGYPPARIAFMLADCDAPVLVAEARFAAVLRVDEERLIVLEGMPSGGPSPIDAATPRAMPGDPAYMIYTSGTTGQPKGALNAHQAICNRLQWMQARYRIGPGDAVLQKTPLSFDVSVWELFWPLLTGARLVMAKPGGHRDAGYLIDVIVHRQITTLHFVPSMLREFLAHPDVERCTSVRDVMCSGEVLSPDLPARLYARLDANLHNLYGPTEAAVDVTHWTVPRDFGSREFASTVPIGTPVANTQIYLLDAAGEPVPLGIAGELYVGGIQVGMGYHRRPELTAERFVPDRFGPEPGARLYRTGDLARHRPDGALEYLGRLDQQVKLRGFRVELGEIETVLRAHPAVRDAAVLLRPDATGEPALVAYVVGAPASTQTGEPAALRAYLARRLPDYMLPAHILQLAALPRGPSGKLDREALPPADFSVAAARTIDPPRTPLEADLAAAFASILGLAEVGVNEDFFALGGQSLLAMRLVATLSQRFGFALGLVTIFEARTAADLAVEIGRRLDAASITNRSAVDDIVADVASLSEAEAEALLSAGFSGSHP